MISFVITFLHTKINTYTTLETKINHRKAERFRLIARWFGDVQMKEKGESR